MDSHNSSIPPPYAATGSTSQRRVPEITLLLLGSPGVGKSTFIRNIARVRNGNLQGSAQDSPATIVPNPTSFQVSLFARPYKITIYRSTSTLFVDPFPSSINCVVFCYAVDDRASLFNVQKYWRRVFAERYETELGTEVPLMLLGLKRELRTGDMIRVGGNRQGDSGDDADKSETEKQEQYVCIMPEQGVRAANEMRCDRYAECSALTGDLMWEALEDVTRMAAGTTTSTGGFSEGSNCCTM